MFKRKVMQPGSRENVFFTAFANLTSNLLLLSACYALMLKMDTFHTFRPTAAVLVAFGTLWSTCQITITILSLFGGTAMIFTVVDNE